MHALLMREVITRYGRENLGVLWLVAEPMIFTLGVAALWTAGGFQHLSNVPIVAFAVTGYSAVLLWRNCANRCVMAIESNYALLFHRNVKVFDLFLTRSILEIAGATASFAVLSVFFTFLEMMPLPIDLLQVIGGWLLLAWFGTALALVVGAGTAYSDVVEKLWGPVTYILFPLSGAAFMVDWLPPELREAVLILPMVHGTEILREGYFGNAVRTHYSAGYLVTSNLLLTLVGLHMVRDAARNVSAR
ncbi:MAG: ABC transporter permease [Burkholderiales bacterium]